MDFTGKPITPTRLSANRGGNPHGVENAQRILSTDLGVNQPLTVRGDRGGSRIVQSGFGTELLENSIVGAICFMAVTTLAIVNRPKNKTQLSSLMR